MAPPQKLSRGHLLAEEQPAPVQRTHIPPPVAQSPVPPKPQARPRLEAYTVVVQNVEAKELLFALAKDAKLNMDIHPGIQGAVTLNAVNQTLPQLLERISKQVDMRWELQGSNLAVMPDTPFLRTYKVDYVNMSRDASGTVTITSQVSSGLPTSSSSSSGGSSSNSSQSSSNNTSSTKIENIAKNHFWEDLTQNIKDILRETDKILPEGSSEEYEEVSGDVATSGTGAQASGGKKARQGGNAAAIIAGSPNPAEFQNRGTRLVRRTTFREAAAVIANPETGVLTVRATARQHAKIQEFLDHVISSARRQVMIEATVAEVRLEKTYQQGIDWSILPFGNTGFGIGQSSSPGAAINQVSTGKFFASYTNAASSIGNISATLKLLEGFGTVKVLSSPKISVLNNQTAILKVVDNEVYFTIEANITMNQTSTNETYTTTATAVPVGFVMSVTPQISDTDTIVLNVRPSISRKVGVALDPSPVLAKANIQNAIPIIRTREMESVMRVEDGKVAVMGGLMEDSLTRDDTAIPGVSRIPLLGSLFANRDDADVRTELVIFLRPTVIRDPSLSGDYRGWRDSLPGRGFLETPAANAPN